MTAASFRSIAWPLDRDRSETASAAIPVWIVRNLAIAVLLQLGVTIAFPEQTWSMPFGVSVLCFLAAGTTLAVAARHAQTYRFHTIMVAAFFALKGSAWLALIAIGGSQGDSTASLLSFTSQFVMIQLLVPRGRRFGAGWPAAFDILGGIVVCVVVAGRFWTPTSAQLPFFSPRYLSYLEYLLYPTLAVVSLIVQRRSPPPFLPAVVIASVIYALTSLFSLELAASLHIPRNSPLWVYGDTALIVYPLIANAARFRQRAEVDTDPGGAPNQVLPAMFAIAVLVLAFGYAQREQTLAALIGAVGLLLYACRVGLVTWQYNKAQTALVEAERQRVESLIDVVHELRSPLASVVLNASALARADDIPPALRKRVDTIANRCDTVTRLLNDVLDLERIEAGLMDISVAPVDVPAACQDALNAVASTAEAAGVALRGPGDRAQPFVAKGDCGLLTRVVVNLLDNAIRFTPAGGVVAVSIGYAGPSQVAVVIEDDGVGLSPDARATLFRRFGHAGTPVNGAKGSGLGLSISASAIAAMQGQLTLAAREDAPGTRATILLKRA